MPEASPNGTHATLGRPVEPTLWDHLEKYLRHLDGRECTPATHHHKKKEISLFLRFLAGTGHSMMAVDVTDDHILLHLEDMKDRGLKAITRDTRYRDLHAWWNWMVQTHITDTNVVSLAPRPKVRKEDKGFMSAEDFKKVLAECDLGTMLGCRRYAMMWVLHTVAARRNELLHLELADLDWRRDRILIRHGKGRKRRVVPFQPEVKEAMRCYLEQREAVIQKKNADWHPCLWVTTSGTAMKYDGIGLDLSRLYQRAGVEVQDCTHVYRRTLTKWAVLQQVPHAFIMQNNGWDSESMIYYYTSAMRDQDEAVEYFQKRRFKPYQDQ